MCHLGCANIAFAMHVYLISCDYTQNSKPYVAQLSVAQLSVNFMNSR